MHYREALLLWAARKTGVVDALCSTAETPAEVASETGVSERAARLTTEGLAAMGFFEELDGRYEPTNRALGFLATTDPRSIGRVPATIDEIDRLVALPETMRAAGAAGAEATADEPPVEHALGALAATDDATVRACVTAAIRHAPDATRMAHVGGSPGTFAREFAARGLDAAVVDTPERIEPARPLLSTAPIDCVEGVPPEAIPAGTELVFCYEALQRRDDEATTGLLSDLAEALSERGTVACVERRIDGERAAGVAARLLAKTTGGEPRTDAELRALLDESGFAEPTVESIPGTELRVAIGHRAID